MGDTPCECGRPNHDPVSGFCESCDPVLYRVVGFPDDWFDGPPRPALSRTVAGRKLGETVARLVAETGRAVEVYADEAA